MNIYFLSYTPLAPAGLPGSVLAHDYQMVETAAPGRHMEFRVRRPDGSNHHRASITVLRVNAHWVDSIEEAGTLEGRARSLASDR